MAETPNNIPQRASLLLAPVAVMSVVLLMIVPLPPLLLDLLLSVDIGLAVVLRSTVQLIWGARDSVFPVAQIYRARDAMPHARPEIFPRSRHYPFRDDPIRFHRVLSDFLSNTDPAAFNPAQWRAARSSRRSRPTRRSCRRACNPALRNPPSRKSSRRRPAESRHRRS